jgi:hypothetical protein
MGVVAGGKIFVPKDTPFPTGISLAAYACFFQGEGNFRTVVRLYDPNGAIMVEAELEPLPKSPEQAAQIVLNMGVLPVIKPGAFKIEFVLNDKVYAETFSITAGDPHAK